MLSPQPPPFLLQKSDLPAATGRPKARKAAALTCLIIVLGYAGLFRWIFAEPWMSGSGGVVSMSFIFSVPFACGALSVAIGRWCGSDGWWLNALVTPAFIMAIGLFICICAQIEAMICVIMASPILFAGTALGGSIAHLLLPRNRPLPHLHITVAVFLPFLTAFAESRLDAPTETKAITNSINIQAAAGEVWPLIASVDAITPEEIPDSWIYRIGFPKPIAATLDHNGLGGIRTATFQRGVSFFEEITVWDQPKKLSFSIHADPDFIPKSAFDQHIIVGGRFYDVLDGTYEIEATGADTCILHLTSNHRLSTRFNAYAGWWSLRIMDQIQGSILEVIRTRAESGP